MEKLVNETEYRRRFEHYTIFEHYFYSFKILWDSYNSARYKTSAVKGSLRGAFTLLHISLENLLKSGLERPIRTHDLMQLNDLFEKTYNKETPPVLKELLKEINPYGFPVSSSLRYQYDASFPFKLYESQDWKYFITIELWEASFEAMTKNTEEWFIRHYES